MDKNQRPVVAVGSSVRDLQNLVSARPWPSAGLTPGLVGLADTKAEDEAAMGTAFAFKSRLNRWVKGAFLGRVLDDRDVKKEAEPVAKCIHAGE